MMMMVVGGVSMIGFWGIVIGLVIWGVGRITGSKAERPDAGETPMEIAQKRLARGEITRDEFEDLKQALQ